MGMNCTVQMVKGSLFYRLSPEMINTNRASSKKENRNACPSITSNTRLDEAIKGRTLSGCVHRLTPFVGSDCSAMQLKC